MNIEMNNSKERPSGLLVISILSWIYIGFNLLMSTFRFVGGPLSSEQIKMNKVDMLGLVAEAEANGMNNIADVFAKMQHMTEVYNQNHYSVWGISVAILSIGLLGVVMMFLGRKLGFHTYIIYSILGVIQVYFFMTPAEIPSELTYMNTAISVLFILLYARHLKWMK